MRHHPESSLWELNSPRSSHASAEPSSPRHPDGALTGTIFAHKIARKRQSLFGQKCEPDSAMPYGMRSRVR